MAKRTYEHTMMHYNLAEATVTLNTYKECKYTGNIKEETEEEFTGLTAFDIIEGGDEATEIEKDLSPEEYDPHHEYLVLHMQDGETRTYRNSYTDMFIL